MRKALKTYYEKLDQVVDELILSKGVTFDVLLISDLYDGKHVNTVKYQRCFQMPLHSCFIWTKGDIVKAVDDEGNYTELPIQFGGLEIEETLDMLKSRLSFKDGTNYRLAYWIQRLYWRWGLDLKQLEVEVTVTKDQFAAQIGTGRFLVTTGEGGLIEYLTIMDDRMQKQVEHEIKLRG